eukprot:458774-Rhodomonas_salina.2
MEVKGTATYMPAPWYFAAIASWYVPTCAAPQMFEREFRQSEPEFRLFEMELRQFEPEFRLPLLALSPLHATAHHRMRHDRAVPFGPRHDSAVHFWDRALYLIGGVAVAHDPIRTNHYSVDALRRHQ